MDYAGHTLLAARGTKEARWAEDDQQKNYQKKKVKSCGTTVYSGITNTTMTKQEFIQLSKHDQIDYLIENTNLEFWMTLSEEDQWTVNDRRKETFWERRKAKKMQKQNDIYSV